MDDAIPGLGLVFLLGLRHGLDPDHIAVIDNLAFQTAPVRPRVTPWTGLLFSLGHSLSVAAVAVGFGLASKAWRWPDWAAGGVEWLAIALLLLVGVLNLRALLQPGPFAPKGWRQGVLPTRLRQVSHPLAILMVGVVFGLLFDTASQAAAWGTAAAAAGGVPGAAAVSAAFAAGMILTDTADSLIVARLLRGRGERSLVVRYRRAVGWLIVALSFGMAAYGLATRAGLVAEAHERMLSAAGVLMVGLALLALALARRARRRPGAP